MDEAAHRPRLAHRPGRRRGARHAPLDRGGERLAQRHLHRAEPRPYRVLRGSSCGTGRPWWPERRRHLRALRPVARGQRRDHGAGHLARRLHRRAEPEPCLAERTRTPGSRGLGEGRRHRDLEHASRRSVRGRDGDRWSRRPIPVRLLPRHRRHAGHRLAKQSTLAPARAPRRRGRRLRLDRRIDVARDRVDRPHRAAEHGRHRSVRHLARHLRRVEPGQHHAGDRSLRPRDRAGPHDRERLAAHQRRRRRQLLPDAWLRERPPHW